MAASIPENSDQGIPTERTGSAPDGASAMRGRQLSFVAAVRLRDPYGHLDRLGRPRTPGMGVHSRQLPISENREWIETMPRTRKWIWARLVASFLVLVGVSAGLVVVVGPFAGIVIGVAAVVGVGSALSRHFGPGPKCKGQGWRMHASGEYQWWDGSKWTESPPGETPRKIGPEIEW